MSLFTSDGEAMHAAILDDTDDDAPRLAYADWLDERGEGERAELIRVQCEFATLGRENKHDPAGCFWQPCDYCNRMSVLHLRERRLLLYETCKGWLPEGFTVGNCSTGPWGTSTQEAVFRRGFVYKIRLTCAAFLTHANELFSSHPITSVVLVDRESHEDVFLPGRWAWMHDTVPVGDGRTLAAINRGIPDDIWRHLVDGDGRAGGTKSGGLRCHWYTSREDADAALSRACVALGREQAGLTPRPGR